MPELMDTHQKLSVGLEKVVCMVTEKMHTSIRKLETTASVGNDATSYANWKGCSAEWNSGMERWNGMEWNSGMITPTECAL